MLGYRDREGPGRRRSRESAFDRRAAPPPRRGGPTNAGDGGELKARRPALRLLHQSLSFAGRHLTPATSCIPFNRRAPQVSHTDLVQLAGCCRRSTSRCSPSRSLLPWLCLGYSLWRDQRSRVAQPVGASLEAHDATPVGLNARALTDDLTSIDGQFAEQRPFNHEASYPVGQVADPAGRRHGIGLQLISARRPPGAGSKLCCACVVVRGGRGWR